MRKMITLIAAAALAASPFAFAEDQTTTGNPNDVLQTVPGPMAESTTTTTSTTSGDATSAAEPAAAPVKKHHHKHHHHVHHHHHHHHTATAPSTDTHTTHEEANSPSGNDMSAPAAH